MIELAGGKPGAQIQGRSFKPLLRGRSPGLAQVVPGRVLQRVGLAVDRRHELQGGAHRARQADPLGAQGRRDELYDLEADPYEIRNVIKRPAYGKVRTRLYGELRKLVAEAAGL